MINDEVSAPESQFQDLNEVVDRNDDTGVMQVESLCMNCHDNVCCALHALSSLQTFIKY